MRLIYIAFALLSGVASSAPGAERPNIILLMGDDHGWDETGYNGHPHLKTPVLDEMAASGLRMDRFYSAHPSCSPTRGSVMTGRHPVRYGTFAPNCSIRPEEITIAHLLKKSGYTCGHFGKWHLGPVKAASPTSPGAMGFDQWLSHDNFFELNPTLSRNGGPPQVFKGESSEIVIAETIEFLKQAQQKKRPFFADIQQNGPSNKAATARCAERTLCRDYGDGSFDRTASRLAKERRAARRHPGVVLRRQWHSG